MRFTGHFVTFTSELIKTKNVPRTKYRMRHIDNSKTQAKHILSTSVRLAQPGLEKSYLEKLLLNGLQNGSEFREMKMSCCRINCVEYFLTVN